MSNEGKAQVKLYELMSEWEFLDLKEKYPYVYDLVLAKLTEDEIQKERVRYSANNLQQENASLRQRLDRARDVLFDCAGRIAHYEDCESLVSPEDEEFSCDCGTYNFEEKIYDTLRELEEDKK